MTESGPESLDIAHQVGVPLAVAMLAALPFAALSPLLFLPPIGALLLLATLGTLDAVRVHPPRGLGRRALGFRASVALHHLCQPAVRWWGRWRAWSQAHAGMGASITLPGPVEEKQGKALLLPHDRDRSEIAAALIALLRRAGMRVAAATGDIGVGMRRTGPGLRRRVRGGVRS